jgi:hypothetical protein
MGLKIRVNVKDFTVVGIASSHLARCSAGARVQTG